MKTCELVEETSTNKVQIRYFKTSYVALGIWKFLLSSNDQGNFPDRQWIVTTIQHLNNNQAHSIQNSEELTKIEYERLMISFPDAGQQN